VTTTSPAIEVAALDAVAQADLVQGKQVTPAELAQWAIERIEELNPTLNAVITPMYDQALAAAAATPSAGLVIVGKTNTPEFGMAPTCEPVLHGPTRNPWDTARSTSGSSGGSAAAVASRMVPMAHGNDLGGSLRYPASACGLFALKPTRARNPLGPEYGDAVNGWACEHALTRTVRDSAVLLDATAGPALGDPYGLPAPARLFADQVGRDPGRLRIGYTATTPEGIPAHPDCVTALDDAVTLCSSLGHERVEADLPGLTPEIGPAIGSIFGAATAWVVEYWIRRLGRRAADDELEPLTRAYWEMGQKVPASDYLLAIKDCQAFARRIAHFLTTIDVWLTPTMSTPPALIGEITSTAEEPIRAVERGGSTVAYAGVVANITGSPDTGPAHPCDLRRPGATARPHCAATRAA
jgi:amidase